MNPSPPNSLKRTPAIFLFVLFCLAVKALGDTQGYNTARLYIAMQLFPFLYDVARKRGSYLGLFGVGHFVSTGLNFSQIVFGEYRENAFAPEQIIAMRESCICYVLLWGTYLIHARLSKKRNTEGSSFQQMDCPPAVFIGAMLIHLAEASIPFPRELLNIKSQLRGVCVVLCLTTSCRKMPALNKIAIPYTFAVGFLGFLRSGMLGAIGGPILLATFPALLTRKVKTIAYPMMGILLCLLIQPVKAAYRASIKTATPPPLSERLDTMGELLGEAYLESDQNLDAEDVQEAALTRLDEDTLARVVRYTPSVVPYWGGTTYEALFYILIPRFIWSKKPMLDWGGRFGKAYGVLAEDDTSTAVTCGYFCEAYINFGFMGMYVVSILIGLLLGSVELLSLNRFRENYLFPFILGFGPFFNQPALSSLLNSVVFSSGSVLLLSLLAGKKKSEHSVWEPRSPRPVRI